MRDYRQFYINGEWISPSGDRADIPVINPATEEAVGVILDATSEDVDRAVKAANDAFFAFSQTSREDRIALLEKMITIYKRRMQDVADAIRLEMGAPATMALESQAETGLGHIEAALNALKAFQFTEKVNDRAYVSKEPIGVCGFITPWNWPMNQIAAKVAPALAMGCTCILKPSEIAPFSAHLFAEIIHEAGVPAGFFNLIDGYGPNSGAAMSAHPNIEMMSFTGSTRAGIEVAKAAANTVKRVTQELGGKSANILLDDCDFERAVRLGTLNCMGNTGQSCNAPTRMLVPHGRMDEAAQIAKQAAESLIVGDPEQKDTDLGPISYDRQYEKVVTLISKGEDDGAQMVCGGPERPEGYDKGYFVKPTVFSHVTNDMTIAKEEIFGPVLCILGYDSEEEAIAVANDTPYGLAAYVSGGDMARTIAVANRLRAGQVSINDEYGDYETPFGGYKQSGNGRESGHYGFEDFIEIKAIIGAQ